MRSEARPFFHEMGGVRRRSGGLPQGRSGWRCLLSRSLESRQGCPVHPWCELHRLLFLEDLRPRRNHHLGGPADRLSIRRSGSAEYEPRGRPRGAAFSWYTYSPPESGIRTRAASCWRCIEAKQRLGDPVLAWADVVNDPERRRRYHQARGKGDSFVPPGPKPWR